MYDYIDTFIIIIIIIIIIKLNHTNRRQVNQVTFVCIAPFYNTDQ